MLIIFILIKLGVAHSVSHAFSHDDITDCDHCILIIDSNKTHSFDCNTEVYENTICYVESTYKPVIILYKNPITRAYQASQFFNKPPPSVAHNIG
ncbi:hypothetical protein [Kordia sp.]|uniref:hypothetical protein n=1 Tax=Kordia sp. TaxID=1965332 RepID=UPI003B5C04AB